MLLFLSNKCIVQKRRNLKLFQMLASILIRIALADAFGGVCSMIALDEPTTNLDRDKVDKSGISEIPGKLEKKNRF